MIFAVVRLETKEGPFYYRNISGEEFIFYYSFKLIPKSRRQGKLQSLQFYINSKTIGLYRVKTVIISSEMVIQETAGPYLHQGAARPARPLALERRRLLLELGTARRLTGSSGDQGLVEVAKTEITRVEKQMRRISRWLLKRRRAMWIEELEEGSENRTFSHCLQIRTSPR